ncbi:MAG: hypothetical protein NC082_00890 [Clostridiales bacterium]|nr:hypothetical protein [Clostridiales bacterium]
MDMTSSKKLTIGDIACERLLTGTLFTARGIDRRTMVEIKGPSYILSPFDIETHSTAYCSRAAILKPGANLQEAHKLLASELPASEIYTRLADQLSQELTADDILIHHH